jgi:hypothetical protein
VRSSSVSGVSKTPVDMNYKALTWGFAVSEDQGLPIGHAQDIALTKEFALGGPR